MNYSFFVPQQFVLRCFRFCRPRSCSFLFPHLKFLCSLHLSLLREIFDLGLAEHDVGITGRVLIHVRFVDDEQNVLGFPNSHTRHTGNLKIRENSYPRYFGYLDFVKLNRFILTGWALASDNIQLTCFSPSLDIIFLAFFSPLLCLLFPEVISSPAVTAEPSPAPAVS